MKLKLTIREKQILNLISEGYSSKEIGEILFLSFETIKTYRYRLIKKFGARNVANMIRLAGEEGFFSTSVNSSEYFKAHVA